MSFAGNRLAGTAFLAVDGITYEVSGALTYSPVSVTRETLKSQSGIAGFKEMPEPGKIGGTIRDAGGLTVASFNAMTNVTITLLLANGKYVYGRNMWTVEAQEVNTEEGTFEVKWEGPDGCVEEDF